MIQALLHHKLTDKQENMEDILTSNVFGLLKYARPECGLFRFLARAQTLDGHFPLADLVARGDTQPARVEYEFWPGWMTENCEPCQPDVVVNICSASRLVVCIEAKYWSGKSSLAAEDKDDDEDEGDLGDDAGADFDEGGNGRRPSDQLAKEWSHLVARATKLDARPVLIYLTADLSCPRDELRDSIKDCGKAAGGDPATMMCWLSWRELSGLFRDADEPHLCDLAALAEKMKFAFFGGMRDVAPLQVGWNFQGPTWQFATAPITCDWRFMQ